MSNVILLECCHPNTRTQTDTHWQCNTLQKLFVLRPSVSLIVPVCHLSNAIYYKISVYLYSSPTSWPRRITQFRNCCFQILRLVKWTEKFSVCTWTVRLNWKLQLTGHKKKKTDNEGGMQCTRPCIYTITLSDLDSSKVIIIIIIIIIYLLERTNNKAGSRNTRQENCDALRGFLKQR